MGFEVTRSYSLDLEPYAVGFLLLVVFPESRSKNLSIAKEIAAGARAYRTDEVGGPTLHLAGFGRELDQVAKARSLLRIVGSWRGTQVFGGGRRLVSAWNADELLQCYQVAAGLPDHRAHCEVQIPYWGYIHPCRLLEGTTGRLVFDGSVDPADQIRGAALRRWVEWCPFLSNIFENINVFKE